MALGHERLDVYRLAIAYVAWVYEKSATLEGVHRAARDQWLRASQSIPLNIAEGNGKTADADRRRYFEIARGSALECAAIQDVLVVGKALDAAESQNRKTELDRMAAMLSRLGGRVYQVRKSEEAYTTGEEEVDPDPDSDSDLDETKPQQGGGGAAMRSPHHRASPPNPFVPTASCPLPTGAQAPSHHAPRSAFLRLTPSIRRLWIRNIWTQQFSACHFPWFAMC